MHWGRAFVGGIGEAGRLVTISVLSDSAKVAVRFSSIAGTGEAVVSEAASQASSHSRDYPSMNLELKGRAEPGTAHVISA